MDSRERKRRLKLNLSSTDMPTVNLNEDDLTFSFTGWDGQPSQIDFQATMAFRWFNNGAECMTIDDDAAFEINRSNWIVELQESLPEASQTEKRLRHYRFCIYNCWVLEVACESFQVNN